MEHALTHLDRLGVYAIGAGDLTGDGQGARILMNVRKKLISAPISVRIHPDLSNAGAKTF